MRRKLQRQLPDVRFEYRLSRAYRTVLRDCLTSALAGHGVDPPPRLHEPVRHQIVGPIDQTMSHHVAGHFHLPFAGDFRRPNQRPQCAERQRVQQHADFAAIRADPLDHLGALLIIGGVDVEEDRLATCIADLLLYFHGVRQRLAAVQMHSVNVIADVSQL